MFMVIMIFVNSVIESNGICIEFLKIILLIENNLFLFNDRVLVILFWMIWFKKWKIFFWIFDVI